MFSDVLVALPGVAPNVLIRAEDLHPVEPVVVVDEDQFAFGQNRRVGCIPRDPETLNNPSHPRELLHDPFQRPPKPKTALLCILSKVRGQGPLSSQFSPVTINCHIQKQEALVFKKSTALACVLLLATSVVPGGVANADSSDGVLEALENVTSRSDSAATKVLDDVASVPTRNDGESAIDTSIQGSEVVAPLDASEPIDLSVPGSEAGLRITLPFVNEASPGEPLSPGIVAFDNNNDTTTTAVLKKDSSLIIATVISSRNAPERYTYKIDGASGSFLRAQPDGSVFLFDAAGSRILGGFLPPWARDASGNNVPTKYEVSENTMTQVVDLSSPRIVLPVVADPQAGYTLLEGVWKNRPGGYS